jgi:hypothetical protein
MDLNTNGARAISRAPRADPSQLEKRVRKGE